MVTANEHKDLVSDPWESDDFTTDPWRRYREAQIRVWDRKTADWVDLEAGIPGVASL